MLLGLIVAAVVQSGVLRADQVEMVNGDRYVGRVIGLGSDTLVLQSELLGTLKLPRARIATIALASTPWRVGTNTLRGAPVLASTNAVPELSAATGSKDNLDLAAVLRGSGLQSNAMQQVQQQFLAGAGPEAQAKFNELMSGLLSGKVGMSDLRKEAKTTLEQAKSVRKEMGDDAGASIDGYLAILEGFLKETEPGSSPTNSPTGLNSVPSVPIR